MQTVGLILASITPTTVSVFALNASEPPLLEPPNSTQANRDGWSCLLPVGAFGKWWYNARNDGPYVCYGSSSLYSWAMVNSYRSGGIENVHWKYTDDPYDLECLHGWAYYAEDGTTAIDLIAGAITSHGDTRTWCALPVYRTGGAEDTQWGYFTCQYESQLAQ